MKRFEVVLYVAMSLDGRIAGANDDLSWLEDLGGTSEEYGFHEMLEGVDCALMGRATYDFVAPYDDFGWKLPTYVATTRPVPDDPRVEVVTGSAQEIMTALEDRGNESVFLVGGGSLVKQFANAELITRMIITIAPTVLGEGPPLFPAGTHIKTFKLTDSKTYPSGAIQVTYEFPSQDESVSEREAV